MVVNSYWLTYLLSFQYLNDKVLKVMYQDITAGFIDTNNMINIIHT